jgi:hypothetical protein
VTDLGFVAEMADELGGPPTLAEFLEVLNWSSSDGRFVATVSGKPYRSSSPSRVGDLGDAVFEDAREYLAGGPDAVLADLRAGQVILADVEPGEIGGLTVETPKKRVARPKPGDVVAIPVSGGYRPAVVLTRNRFGTALGLFRGVSPNGQVGRLRGAPGRHVYTDETLIKNGTWPVVDHDESLSGLFPADPPIYHKPGAWPGIDTGEYGAAETAEGSMTPLSASEAAAVGLTDGTYRQTMNSAFLQKQLDA